MQPNVLLEVLNGRLKSHLEDLKFVSVFVRRSKPAQKVYAVEKRLSRWGVEHRLHPKVLQNPRVVFPKLVWVDPL